MATIETKAKKFSACRSKSAQQHRFCTGVYIGKARDHIEGAYHPDGCDCPIVEVRYVCKCTCHVEHWVESAQPDFALSGQVVPRLLGTETKQGSLF
jgi:hypothetical protein